MVAASSAARASSSARSAARRAAVAISDSSADSSPEGRNAPIRPDSAPTERAISSIGSRRAAVGAAVASSRPVVIEIVPPPAPAPANVVVADAPIAGPTDVPSAGLPARAELGLSAGWIGTVAGRPTRAREARMERTVRPVYIARSANSPKHTIAIARAIAWAARNGPRTSGSRHVNAASTRAIAQRLIAAKKSRPSWSRKRPTRSR
jgi:hypothetical protein